MRTWILLCCSSYANWELQQKLCFLRKLVVVTGTLFGQIVSRTQTKTENSNKNAVVFLVQRVAHLSLTLDSFVSQIKMNHIEPQQINLYIQMKTKNNQPDHVYTKQLNSSKKKKEKEKIPKSKNYTLTQWTLQTNNWQMKTSTATNAHASEKKKRIMRNRESKPNTNEL